MENRGRAQKPGKIKESGKEHQGGVLVTFTEYIGTSALGMMFQIGLDSIDWSKKDISGGFCISRYIFV